MLLESFLDIVSGWQSVFPQTRTYQRGVRQGLGSLVCLGRRTLSRIIWTNGGAQRSWSGEYFLHSRCQWEAAKLFRPILAKAHPWCTGRLVGVAVDETRVRKTGRRIQQAFYQRDPMSPPFHCNLMLGLRFLQASLLVPLHRQAAVSCRSLPVRFEEVSTLKKPSGKLSDEEWKQFRKQKKLYTVSHRLVTLIPPLRKELDEVGGSHQIMVLAVDGSFCNRIVFSAPRDRTELIARARKDAVLCFPDTSNSRRVYSREKFTPESVRQDESIPWETTKIFYGGKRRKVRYKEVPDVLWQGGARRLPLRLIVVAPTPYRKMKSGRTYYRQPSFLLTTDGRSKVRGLLQIYFDRWQIEVNHREEKDTLGVGQAQLWNETSVPKQPALTVAAYSAMLLASLLAFGAKRNDVYAPLPKWRRHAQRPSCLDLVALLRKEMAEHHEILAPFKLFLDNRQLTAAADA